MQAAGIIAVGLAVLGIFLPVLPTVPFLLLALACFARSSEKFYQWLLTHDRLGPLVRPYLEKEGIPPAAKRKAIVLIWISIGFSVTFFVSLVWVRGLLLLIALAVTIYIFRLPEDEQAAD